MKRKRRPPPVIGGLYVLEYAHADKSVRFEQRHWLNVGGKWLGRVPCLAICQAFDENTFTAQLCTEDWDPRGCAGDYQSVREVKEKLERSYHGVSSKWKRQPVPKRKAQAAYEAELAAQSCSFCGRSPFKVTGMIETKDAETRICNHCVAEFQKLLVT